MGALQGGLYLKAKIKGYAKINLLLDVLRKRNDGYHDVQMIMQAIELYDEIIIQPAETNQLWLTTANIPNDESNLAMQAALLMQKNFSQVPPLAIELKKNIPVAAGLAGGSTDGAAVLLGIKTLFHLECSMDKLLQLAAQLGSDVPFCLSGPTALASGRGEILTALAECPRLYLVLVKPPFGVSTAEIYGHLNTAEIKDRPDFDYYCQALQTQNSKIILSHMSNALERSTFALYPDVAETKRQLQQLGAKYVLMSGSGPTVFCAFQEKIEAETFYKKAKEYFQEIYFSQTITATELKERVSISDES